MRAREHRGRARRLGCILGFLTAATCLAILEIGTRLDDWRRGRLGAPPPADIALLQENPAGTGSYRLRPGLDLVTRVENTEVRIVTNSHGMRWRETPVQAAPGVRRVAFLGDSFTFGSWASDASRSFVGIFDSRLAGLGFEALNFGVGGYGLLDEELLLQEKVLDFEPSYVVVVIYNGNDFRDTWLGLDRERIVNGGARLNDETIKARVPPEDLFEDPTLAQDCPAPPLRRLAQASAAFQRIAPFLHLENRCVRFRPNRNFFMPAFWSRRPPPAIALLARQSVLDSLARMDELLTARRVRLSVVALPTSDQVYAQEPSGPGFDTALPQSGVEEFCRDRRIPYLDLLPLLRREAASSFRRLYLRSDIHLDDHGHSRIGVFIADWFQSRVVRP